MDNNQEFHQLIYQKQDNNQENKNNNQIQLTEEELFVFYKAFQKGIYKELHKRKMITDNQLNQLLRKIK